MKRSSISFALAALALAASTLQLAGCWGGDVQAVARKGLVAVLAIAAVVNRWQPAESTSRTPLS